MPQRIQRERVKGWRMPEGAVYVGRPTKWGNPFRVGSMLVLTGKKAGQKIDAEGVVQFFRHSIEHASKYAVRQEIRAELAGRDLVCWCPIDAPCHADVLLDIANKSEVSR